MLFYHFGDAVGAAGMMGVGQAGLETVLMCGGNDGLMVGGDPDLLRAAFCCLLGNSYYHGFPGDGQQRFARQAGGGEACRDDDVEIHHLSCSTSSGVIARASSASITGMSS